MPRVDFAGYTWLELSPLTGRKHQVRSLPKTNPSTMFDLSIFTHHEHNFFPGVKPQLRVHCAEVLGTPIVGDYKYGWQAHRNWKPLCLDGPENKGHQEEIPNMKNLPFGLNLESGSVTEKQPRLHLHCKQLVLPNISKALEHAKLRSDCDLSQIQSLEFDAPMPLYMQTSWDIINSQGTE